MKKATMLVVVMLAMLAFAAGCSNLSHESPALGRIDYTRIGDMKIGSVKIGDPNSLLVELTGVESKGEAPGFANAAQAITQGMIEAFKLGLGAAK